MRRRILSQKEIAAWQRVTRNVRPLHRVRVDIAEEADAANSADRDNSPPQAEADNMASMPIEWVESLVSASKKARPKPTPPIANRKPEKRIRRGKIEIEATLDLHGLTVAQAIAALESFVIKHQHIGTRCILVITGKGHPTEGRIRREFRLWLERPATAKWVSGYALAHVKHGGSGAFYVFPRKKEK